MESRRRRRRQSEAPWGNNLNSSEIKQINRGNKIEPKTTAIPRLSASDPEEQELRLELILSVWQQQQQVFGHCRSPHLDTVHET